MKQSEVESYLSFCMGALNCSLLSTLECQDLLDQLKLTKEALQRQEFLLGQQWEDGNNLPI